MERGFLLVRVRDELRMTNESYQALYESAIAYGMRKALLLESKKTETKKDIQKLENECETLQKEVDDLEKNLRDTEKNFKDETARLEKKHKDAVELGKTKNQLLKEDLQRLLSVPSSLGQDKRK